MVAADGFDFSLGMAFDWGKLGDFRLNIEATYLMTLDVERNELLNSLAGNGNSAFGTDFTVLEVNRVRLDGNPRWRASTTWGWTIGNFGLGGSVRYIAALMSDFVGRLYPGRGETDDPLGIR